MPAPGTERDKTSKGGEISVAKDGGDYATIKEALQNAVARDVIRVSPGIYQEDNPLPAAPSNVAIVATGSLVNTRIEATNINQDLFTTSDALSVQGIALASVTGTGWVIDISSDHSVLFENCAIFQCEQGVKLNSASADLGLSECLVLSTGGVTLATGAQNNAGNLTVAGMRVLETASITTLFNFDGANAISTVYNLTTFEAGVDTVLLADNDARSVFNSCSLVGMNDGAVLQGGSDTRFVATSIFNVQQDAIRITNAGTGTNFTGQGLTIEDSGRYDLNGLSASSTVSGYGQASLDKMNFTSGAEFTFIIVDLKEGDPGLRVIGELHVGLPEVGTEFVAGGGDSYTRGMLVYTETAASAFTDVSTAARSASGSTFTFPGVAQNNAIYMGSSLMNGGDYIQHYGIKATITTAAVLGGGRIAVEYWNGAAWVEINHMSTLADSPYTQYAKNIFERTGSEQVRYPAAFLSSWTKNDPMTLGTDYFWIRFRIATAITTSPIFQQYKLHTSRFEVNADGVTEYFGAGRYPRDLPVNIALSQPVTGSAPGNAAVAFSATITLTIPRNQFNNNAVDAFGILVTVPVGIDTSIPLILEDLWQADTANAGDVELVASAAQLEIGDPWDGTAAEVSTAQVETVGAGTRYVSRATNFSIDISDLVPGELLVLKVERNATVGNDPPDTLAGNIIHGSLRAFGTFWRP
jgi:hypothetical protein